MKILGIIGTMGSGKDTIAEILRKNHGWEIAAQADALKRITHRVFGTPNALMFGESALRATRERCNDESTYWADVEQNAIGAREYILNHFPPQYREAAWIALFREIAHFASNRDKCTVRYILQRMGTEWGRSVYPQVWVDSLGHTLANLGTGKFFYFREKGLVVSAGEPGAPPGVVITDCRFENEILAVRGWGGKSVWVDASSRVKPSGDTHASEPVYEKFIDLVDGAVDNNSTMQQLEDEVAFLLKNEEFWL